MNFSIDNSNSIKRSVVEKIDLNLPKVNSGGLLGPIMFVDLNQTAFVILL